MKQDPIFKERFGISTSIRYLSNVIVEAKTKKDYEKAWKEYQKKHQEDEFSSFGKRFEGFLNRLEKLGDDLPYTKRIEIRYINDRVGYGVFAKVNIPAYSILNHYAGILKPDKSIKKSNDSAFVLSDFPEFSIDGQKQGNWCRFMNHGQEKDKHTNVIAWEHYSSKGPRVLFTSGKKGIRKGQQLLYSYGDSYWEDKEFEKL